MRILFAVAVLAVPASAFSATTAGEDRYGPAVSHTPPAANLATPYTGPFLTWASKAAAPTPAVAPAPEPAAAPAPSAPTSLYAAPASPAPTPQTIAPAPAAPPAAAPAQAIMAPAPAGETPQAVAAPASPPAHARFYSLHREYGDTPDRIALPASRPMVLVGPPESPAQTTGQDDGDGGKAAAGPAPKPSDPPD
ncbi:MAG: hypothetical protein ACHP84_11260 [Caulobacterales bacterium]